MYLYIASILTSTHDTYCSEMKNGIEHDFTQDRIEEHHTFYLNIDTKYSKTSTSHGMLSPISWTKPNSSSAWFKRLWNSVLPRYEIGTMYLLLFSPTYTTKWPFGTSNGRLSSLTKLCLLPFLVHRLIISFIIAFCDILLDFSMAIFGGIVEETMKKCV